MSEAFFLLPSLSLIFDGIRRPLFKKGHLSHSILQDIVVIDGFIENFRIRPEGGLRTGTLGLSQNLQLGYSFSLEIFLLVHFPPLFTSTIMCVERAFTTDAPTP